MLPSSDIHGNPLDLNNPDDIFMNRNGVLFATDAELAYKIVALKEVFLPNCPLNLPNIGRVRLHRAPRVPMPRKGGCVDLPFPLAKNALLYCTGDTTGTSIRFSKKNHPEGCFSLF
ncbi:hypothetical protein P4C99_08395 [Pontiellaceae bacterium B1224]|nr:hypothetical protein [Pontiellaceae bacterium B1224]